MMKLTGKSPPARQAWSDYWDRHGADGQHQVGGVEHCGLFEAFWSEKLSAEFAQRNHVRMLDAACGDGAVAKLGRSLAGEAVDCTADVHASDYSVAALNSVGQSSGGADIDLVVADALALPYREGSFDVVASQCGLEYAGRDAFGAAAKLVAPHGRMLAVIHCTDGVIFNECAANLEVLDHVDRSGALAACGRLFELQRQLLSGRVLARVVVEAAAKLGVKLTRLDEAVRRCAPGAARSHAIRLLGDLTTLQLRFAAYEADVARDWLTAQAGELTAFRQRMSSMMDAAEDRSGMSDIAAGFDAAGLPVVELGELRRDSACLPLAWTLSAAAA